MNDLFTSYIRTAVPSLVGAVATWLATKGMELDEGTLAGLVAFLTGTLTMLYYLVVRMFEKYVSPKFGWLLGYPKAPAYRQTQKPSELPSDM